jgi:hypothetical protein
MNNIKILKLNSLDSTVSLSTDKSSFTYVLNNETIRNKGKVLVEVISAVVQICANSDKSNKILDNNQSIIVLRCNIDQEGLSTQTNGAGNIIATFSDVEAKTSANADQTSPLTFICNQLPSQIVLERMAYTAANPSVLEPANTYTTRPLLFSVDLKLTFLEDLN